MKQRNMQHKLTQIVENTRKEVAERKRNVSEAMLYAQLPNDAGDSLFYNAILQPKSGNVGIIAEIKRSSPSAGEFKSDLSLQERVEAYQNAGADAISYVSDTTYFGGSLDELLQVKLSAKIPVLKKDFIIDMYQIVEAAIRRVDALLLIARILDERELKSFVNFAQINSIEPVVEVYNEADLEKALKSDTRVIGVNARNLDTFTINKEAACSLLTQVPKRIATIGFSGIEAQEHVQQYKNAGVKAVLVGSALMNSVNITDTIFDSPNVPLEFHFF